MYDVYEIRKDFPVLAEKIHGKPNVFLDSAASAQKPVCVLDKMNDICRRCYANVHRGIYQLSEETTAAYENAREIVRRFINAASADEIVFTRNATEAVNLVAATWGRKFLKPGDEVLISQAEHHANLVPWQMLRDEIGFTLKISDSRRRQLSGRGISQSADTADKTGCGHRHVQCFGHDFSG